MDVRIAETNEESLVELILECEFHAAAATTATALPPSAFFTPSLYRCYLASFL
jgi:hypothetical protein